MSARFERRPATLTDGVANTDARGAPRRGTIAAERREAYGYRQQRRDPGAPRNMLPFVARHHARQAKPDRVLAPHSKFAVFTSPAACRAARTNDTCAPNG